MLPLSLCPGDEILRHEWSHHPAHERYVSHHFPDSSSSFVPLAQLPWLVNRKLDPASTAKQATQLAAGVKARLVGRFSQHMRGWLHPPARNEPEAKDANVRLGKDAEPVVRREQKSAARPQHFQRLLPHQPAVAYMLEHRVGHYSIERPSAERKRLGVRANQGYSNSWWACFTQPLAGDEEPPECSINRHHLAEFLRRCECESGGSASQVEKAAAADIGKRAAQLS